MKKFFKELFRSNQSSKSNQYGIVIITNDGIADQSKYKNELASITRYPHVVKSHILDSKEAMEMAPNLPISQLPSYALIREGIDSTQSLSHRLENAVTCSHKLTEIILLIELLKEQN